MTESIEKIESLFVASSLWSDGESVEFILAVRGGFCEVELCSPEAESVLDNYMPENSNEPLILTAEHLEFLLEGLANQLGAPILLLEYSRGKLSRVVHPESSGTKKEGN